MAVSRKRPKPEEISKVVKQASQKDPDIDLKPAKKRKVAKSKDPSYKKLTVYLSVELIGALKIWTAKNPDKDLSEMTEDIVKTGLKEVGGLTD